MAIPRTLAALAANTTSGGVVPSSTSVTTTNYTFTESGGKLLIKYGATTVLSIDSTGKLTSANDIVAGGTP